MRLGPDKPGINQPNFIETFQFFQTDCQEFTRFGFGNRPGYWRGKEAITITTEVDSG